MNLTIDQINTMIEDTEKKNTEDHSTIFELIHSLESRVHSEVTSEKLKYLEDTLKKNDNINIVNSLMQRVTTLEENDNEDIIIN